MLCACQKHLKLYHPRTEEQYHRPRCEIPTRYSGHRVGKDRDRLYEPHHEATATHGRRTRARARHEGEQEEVEVALNASTRLHSRKCLRFQT